MVVWVDANCRQMRFQQYKSIEIRRVQQIHNRKFLFLSKCAAQTKRSKQIKFDFKYP